MTQLGVVFPQSEIGSDPGAVRAFAQAAEDLGCRHLQIYDHVLGADASVRPGWTGFDAESPFHEVFVLFGFLAAVTTRLRLFTGVLVLPQRQTALVAKQAAEVDVLTGGRLTLGVGLGYNEVEYEALGMAFADRAERFEEQIALLRRLFTEPSLSFEGRWNRVTAAAINPLPVQRPIPIWIGGSAPRALRRAARLGDGFLPEMAMAAHGGLNPRDAVAQVRALVAAAGRDVAAYGVNARVNVASGDPGDWRAEVETWRALDVSHITLTTMGAGYAGPDEHIGRLQAAIAAIAA
jgi:probable F420-dependent oxidoreductase